MNAIERKWECRYSSCEMMYLQVNDQGTEVQMYLDHSPAKGDRWSADEILRGEITGEIRVLFGNGIGEKLKTAILALQANPIHPETEAEKHARREARRREPWPPKQS